MSGVLYLQRAIETLVAPVTVFDELLANYL